MPKSYWTRIQTPNGLKYFRADDVTDELMQKIKNEADDVFYVEYGTTTFADAEAAYLAGKTLVCREVGQTVQQTHMDDLYFLIDYMPTAGTYTGHFVFSNISGQAQTNVGLTPSATYTKTMTTMATRQDVIDTLSAEIAPDYNTVVQKCYDDDSFPIPAGTYVTYPDNTSSSVLQYFYKSKVAIERWESATSNPITAPQKWDKICVADELGKTFFATMFTTPYSEIKAAYDAGRSIIAVNGHAFYHMFDYNESAGYERFRFSLVQGNTFLLWTCNKTGYDGTHGWNPQPDFSSCAYQGDIAPRYSSESTYDVGDLAYSDGGMLYRCTTAISTPETWNSNHWTSTTVADEFKRTSNIDTWTEVQISSVSATVADFHWCKMYYNDTLRMYSLNFWCTISNVSSLALGWNNLFEVDIQDAPNILNFACRSRRGDANVWVSENLLEQIGFDKVAGKVYLRLFNSDMASSGERLYYAPTISFPATYFSGT